MDKTKRKNKETLQRRLLEAYFAFKVQFKGPRYSWVKQLTDHQVKDFTVQDAVDAVFPRFGKSMPRPLTARTEEAIRILLDTNQF